MNTKVHAPRAMPEDLHPLNVRIEGMRSTGEPNVFEIMGIRPVHVDLMPTIQELVAAGIEMRDAETYVDEFYTMIRRKELAKALAARIEVL